MKKWWIIALIIGVLIAIIGVLGIYIYYMNNITDKNAVKSKELANDIKEVITNEEVVTTSSKEKDIEQNRNEDQQKYYKLKEHNGVIGIFEVNSENDETFVKDTEIQTKYLPEIDLMKLESGIILDSKEKVSSALEDFE